MENAVDGWPTDGTHLPNAWIGKEFVGPDAWLIRPKPLPTANPAEPDVGRGLGVIDTISVTASPIYAITLAGVERLGVHTTYHLVFRPLSDPQRHNLRDLWIDTKTYDLWKAHYTSTYVADGGSSPSDVTTIFAPVAGYWMATETTWTYVPPLAFGKAALVLDATTRLMVFPKELPGWLFDQRRYDRHRHRHEPDYLASLLPADRDVCQQNGQC